MSWVLVVTMLLAAPAGFTVGGEPLTLRATVNNLTEDACREGRLHLTKLLMEDAPPGSLLEFDAECQLAS